MAWRAGEAGGRGDASRPGRLGGVTWGHDTELGKRGEGMDKASAAAATEGKSMDEGGEWGGDAIRRRESVT